MFLTSKKNSLNKILNNPAPLQSNVSLNITFEANQPLKSDVEFKLTYVGSANSEINDQVLDSILVGPVPVGVNQFVFETDPPNPSLIVFFNNFQLIVCLFFGIVFLSTLLANTLEFIFFISQK
jgi:hypothetical protein